MSKNETPMTRWYWKQLGGTLVEEFIVVHGSVDRGTTSHSDERIELVS